jgi:SAM-dependent methyltransferase
VGQTDSTERAVLRGELNDFGVIADVYDELVSWAPYGAWVRKLERRLRRWGLAPDDLILDAACGTGLSTLPWLERGYRVVGTDGSQAMLRQARRRVAEAGQQAQFYRRDLTELRLEGSFDAAVCMHSGLDYILEMAELEAAFRSLRRALRRGGLLAFDKCLDESAFYRSDRSEVRDLSCGQARFEYHWDQERAMLVQRLRVVRTDGAIPRELEVTYRMMAVPPDELIAMVVGCGFVMLERPRQFKVSDPGMGIFRAV